MILELDFSNDVPIYMQIRNQVVIGIADGRLIAGERLPTIRALANESGINMMTANKAYALLKQEGYIQTDRRSGAIISCDIKGDGIISEKINRELRLLISEAELSGVPKQDFLMVCGQIYDEMEGEK